MFSVPPREAFIIGAKDVYLQDEIVDLKCSVTPGNPRELSFAWFDDGREIMGMEHPSYSFRGEVSTQHIWCRASNSVGYVNSSAVKIDIKGLLTFISTFIPHTKAAICIQSVRDKLRLFSFRSLAIDA